MLGLARSRGSDSSDLLERPRPRCLSLRSFRLDSKAPSRTLAPDSCSSACSSNTSAEGRAAEHEMHEMHESFTRSFEER